MTFIPPVAKNSFNEQQISDHNHKILKQKMETILFKSAFYLSSKRPSVFTPKLNTIPEASRLEIEPIRTILKIEDLQKPKKKSVDSPRKPSSSENSIFFIYNVAVVGLAFYGIWFFSRRLS